MGRAAIISATIVVLCLILVLAGFMFQRQVTRQAKHGDLNRQQEQRQSELLALAARIFRDTGDYHDIEESDVLSARTRRNITSWMSQYNGHLDRLQKENRA